MFTAWHLAAAAILSGLTFSPAFGAAEGSPAAKRHHELAIQSKQANAEHLTTTRQAVDATSEAFLAGGNASLSDVLTAASARLQAELALSNTRDGHIAAYGNHLTLCKQLEEKIEALRAAGKTPDANAKLMKAYRYAAEIAPIRILATVTPHGSPQGELAPALQIELAKASTARLSTARQAVEATAEAFLAGNNIAISDVLLAMNAHLAAELGIAKTPEEKLAAHKNHMALSNQIEKKITALHAIGEKAEATAKLMKAYRQAAWSKVFRTSELSTPPESRVASAQAAVDAMSEAFFAGDKIALSDLLMAMDIQLESAIAVDSHYKPWVVEREKQIATAKRLEERINVLCKAGRRGEEAATLIKSYREIAEIGLIQLGLSLPL